MGLAADNLRAARVVTANGHVVTASETENADLFWAIRGGGGNFGIVVELEFALRPVGPLVLGGMLLWPRERAGEVMRAYRDLMADAPDALCGGLALMTAQLTRYQLAANPPDLLLCPQVEQIGMLEFTRVLEGQTAGEAAAEAAMEQLLALRDWRNEGSNWLLPFSAFEHPLERELAVNGTH